MTIKRWISENIMKPQTRFTLKMHFAPASRIEREGTWRPAFHEVDRRGQPLHPRITKTEAERRAKQGGAVAVFHPDFASARAAALVLPGE